VIKELKQIYEKIYGWKINRDKFAKELKLSTGKVSQDLELASAIKKYPEIRECKKKTEALRKRGTPNLHNR